MSRGLRTYLRAKAIWLGIVLDPPMRGDDSPTTIGRVKTEQVETAYANFKNAADDQQL